MFYTSEPLSGTRIISLVRGSESPTVGFSIKFNPNKTLAGTELINNGVTTTNTTTGDLWTSFNNPYISGNNFCWIFISQTGGNLSGFHETLFYTF